MSYTLTNDITGTVASPKVLTSSDDLKIYTITGAGVRIGFQLPAADSLTTIGFMVTDTDGVDVRAATGETIRLGTTGNAVGGTNSVRASALGDVLILSARSGAWVTISRVPSGNWTIV